MDRASACPGNLPSDSSNCALHVDFGFLAAQTFGDRALERELLELFLEQGRKLIPTLPGLKPGEQNDAAHRFRGACRAIGAFPAGEDASRYEDSSPVDRASAYARLVAAFADAEAAILSHLAAGP
jgi:hypothetical protein